MKILVESLKANKILVIPTDVGFELVCDASDADSVELLRNAFEAHSATSYAVVVGSIDQLGRYIKEFPEMAVEVMEVAESPLNVVLPNAININEALLLPNGSVPFRVVKKGLIHDLSMRNNRALLSVPASKKGKKIPTTVADIDSEFEKYVVPCADDTSSTGKLPPVLDIDMNGVVKILRD